MKSHFMSYAHLLKVPLEPLFPACSSPTIPVVELFHLGPWSLVILNCHSTDGLISHLPSISGSFFLNLNNVMHSRPTDPVGSPSNYQIS